MGRTADRVFKKMGQGLSLMQILSVSTVCFSISGTKVYAEINSFYKKIAACIHFLAERGREEGSRICL
jgi:hypothetical protein